MESLYNFSEESELTFYIYNDKRTIYVDVKSPDIKQTYSFMGPKNLIGFHRINTIQENVVYVESYFSDDSQIYSEEDYIDLADVLGDYNMTALLENDYKVALGRADISEKDKLIDLALLVSDNMALVYVDDASYPYDCIEIVNLARTNYRALVNFDTLDILRTNMSKSMIKRATNAVIRNLDLIKDEINTIHQEQKYA